MCDASFRVYLILTRRYQDFFRIIPLDCVKAYFRCMFRALRDIHTRGIIHRDVKPANFLFDPRTGIGTLCDFGLACVSKLLSGSNCIDHIGIATVLFESLAD